MTKEEYIKLALSKWDEIEKLKDQDNLYDYEKCFDKLWAKLGKDVLEMNLGEVPRDRRK